MISRKINKFCTTLNRVIWSYQIDIPSEEMRFLFDVGDDDDMLKQYDIVDARQQAFFQMHGVPIIYGEGHVWHLVADKDFRSDLKTFQMPRIRRMPSKETLAASLQTVLVKDF